MGVRGSQATLMMPARANTAISPATFSRGLATEVVEEELPELMSMEEQKALFESRGTMKVIPNFRK
jgi:hypothetical protein